MGKLLQEAQEELQRLNEQELQEVRQFIRQLQQRKKGESLCDLFSSLGGLSAEEANTWEKRVEQDCRRVDIW